MCNTTTPTTTAAPAAEATGLDREVQLAQLRLQTAQAHANADYNLSVAGQIQRQFEAMQRCAKPYAESTVVPTAYRGNLGNCIIALDIAHRMNLPAIAVMQNLHVINGNPSWSAKFLVATINTCGRFTNLRYRKQNLGKVGKIHLKVSEWKTDSSGQRVKVMVDREFDGTKIDNWQCIAYATEKRTGEVLESDPVTIEMAIREGWYTKDGSKWLTMPMLMLSYRAAAFWQRIYAPELSIGFRTTEEEEDIIDVDYTEIQPTATNANPDTTTARPRPSADEAKARLRNSHTESPTLDMP